MPWILALIGALLGLAAAEEVGLVLGLLLGGALGWAIARERRRTRYLAAAALPQPDVHAQLRALHERLAQLERTVAALSGQPADAARAAAQPSAAANERPERHSGFEAARELAPQPSLGAQLPAGQLAPEQSAPLAAVSTSSEQAVAESVHASTASAPEPARGLETEAAGPGSAREAATARVPMPPTPLEALRDLLFGGNTVVRVGVLVLTVGVGLLAKYAAEHAVLPLELRLALAACIGIALVLVGYRVQGRRPGFGTALQGGGVGALYLVTFFAYHSYELLPGSLALLVLVAIAACSSLLAVVQNAVQLAVFGAIGGFLAPVLAASGQGNHIALFSYYALLNATIAAIALFRAWRVLNWVGFAFTFGIASAWGALRYEPAHMASASFFLGLFFLFYVVDGTLFALKQPPSRRGAIDTTLTFGTPLATLALAAGLFRLQHFLLALACVLIAAVYVGAAQLLLRRGEPALATLAQAYVAIGIGVATLAVPFALESALATALAWATEASALVWVGIRQQRLRTRVAGYLLSLAAVLALAARIELASAEGRALFAALMALALGFSALRVEHARGALRSFEGVVGHVLFAAALLLWSSALSSVIEECLPLALRGSAWALAVASTATLLEQLGRRLQFDAGRLVARFVLPLLLLVLALSSLRSAHPFAHFGWLAWPLSLGLGYRVLYLQRSLDEGRSNRRDLLHASGAYLLALLLLLEAHFVTEDWLALGSGWVLAACLLAPLVPVGLALRAAPRWPVAAHPRAYLRLAAWPLALALLAAALLAQLTSRGDPTPLPYIPLLNPLDLAQALLIAALLLVAESGALRSASALRVARWSAALGLFVALTGTVVRSAHHWADVPFSPWQLPSDARVQAALSILWTALALLAMVFAHRRAERGPWMAGAGLLAVVMLKLFLLDLDKLGSVSKIVTFLAVGSLLLVIGYFAPVPPARAAREVRT